MAQETAPSPQKRALRHFGSSGVRGPYGKIDADFAMRLGRAVGQRWGNIVVGRDARRTGQTLEHAFIAGAMASGAHVTRLGIVPTPLIAHAAREHDVGVQVTASHNPAPDNGFKLWTPAGSAVEHDDLVAIEASMEDLAKRSDADDAHDAAASTGADWTSVGSLTDREGAIVDHLDALEAAIARNAGHAVGSKPLADLRIALDCAHGAGATVTPLLLTRLGAALRVVGGNPDGRFPDRPSEPTAKNLAAFSRLVAEGDFHLGIAHDGDADRTVFLAPDGHVIDNVRLMTLIAELRGDAKAALPVDASGVFTDRLPKAHLTSTPVGDIYLSRAVASGDATIACEPSGTWFFADWSPTPEGPYAAGYVACLVAANPGLLGHLDTLPTYVRASEKVRWPEDVERQQAIASAAKLADELGSVLEGATITTIDGVHARNADGWVLVRASGTEPLFRVTAESQDEETTARLVAIGERALDSVLGGGSS